jgi:excisionase family DNA binding protein
MSSVSPRFNGHREGNPMNIECQTITVEEAGRVLGISRNTAYEAARTGQLPVIRLGRRMRVPKVALQRLLDSAAPTPKATV